MDYFEVVRQGIHEDSSLYGSEEILYGGEGLEDAKKSARWYYDPKDYINIIILRNADTNEVLPQSAWL